MTLVRAGDRYLTLATGPLRPRARGSPFTHPPAAPQAPALPAPRPPRSHATAASSDAAQTQPFGPPDDPTRYKWYSDVGSVDLYGTPGWGPGSYGSGGYVAYLPANGTLGRAVVAQLLADRWIDKATRALAIDFNVWNPDTNLLTVVRLWIEFSPTGASPRRSLAFFYPG